MRPPLSPIAAQSLRRIADVQLPASDGSILRADLLIAGSTIVAIRPPGADGVDVPPLIAGEGLFALPGLIDLHVHAASVVASAPMTMRELTAKVGRNCQAMLQAGVTSARDLGGPLHVLVALREAARTQPGLPGLTIAGPVFTAPGGHPVSTIFRDQPALARLAACAIDDVAEVRSAVGQLIAHGVDLIKVIVTRRLAVPGPARYVAKLRHTVLAAIVEAAHSAGCRVVAHTITAADVAEVLDAGVDGIEHGVVVDPPGAYDDDLVARLIQRGICYVPTLVAIEALAPEYLPLALANVRRLANAGVTIGAGSDAGNPGIDFGSGLRRELALLVRAGLTPLQAIGAATSTAAAQIGCPHLGVLRPGAQADLMLVAQDPRKSLDALGDLRYVIRAGQVVVGPQRLVPGSTSLLAAVI
jgi:imidazolonepropionase-like amidohydrolase